MRRRDINWTVNQEKALASGQAAIDAFPDLYRLAYQNGMRKKLGLTGSGDDDEVQIQDLLALMEEEKTDFTLTFCRRSSARRTSGSSERTCDSTSFISAAMAAFFVSSARSLS